MGHMFQKVFYIIVQTLYYTLSLSELDYILYDIFAKSNKKIQKKRRNNT